MLHSLHIVPLSERNPYQQHLVSSIRDGGEQAAFADAKTLMFKTGLLRKNPDIIHLHWLHRIFFARGRTLSFFKTCLLLTKLILLRGCGVKIVWTVHNLSDHEKRFPRLDFTCRRCVSRLAHALVVHGESARAEVANTLGIRSYEKIVVIPHGNYVDTYPNQVNRKDARTTLNLPEHDVIFLFMGMLRPYKGIFDLLEAYRGDSQEGRFLVVAGKPLDDEFRKKIRRSIGESDSILFCPRYVAEEEIQVFMNAADVVVLPYREVLTSGAAILAMSFAKACIAPRQGCLGDVLDERGAFLYESDDEDGLRGALQEAFVNRENTSTMGLYNREKVDQWNWESVGKMVCELYRSL